MSASRSLMLWFPDWPIRAALEQPPPHPAVAIVHGNTILACSAAARAQGVRRGQRRRVAQSRCPQLQLIRAHPPRDERAFVLVMRTIEEHAPGAALIRPGLLALRARGVSRYYGGEQSAADQLLQMLSSQGFPEVHIGIADGLFTAELAARTGSPLRVIPPGAAHAFLAPLPLSSLGDAELTDLLHKLGIRSLGEFAALDENTVRDRLGERGVHLRRLAAGADARPVDATPLDPELQRTVRFETPLLQADQIAFAVRQTADAVLDALSEGALVCTEVTIDLVDDSGMTHTRQWLHPRCFEASDLVDRVRWQLESLATPDARSAGAHAPDHEPAGITEVTIAPHRVDSSAHHQPGLFGQGPEQRLHHTLSRVQALLGHRGVLSPQLAGGRRLSDRQQLIPWGDRLPPERDPALPWPGSLPPPYPGEIFTPPLAITVTGHSGQAPRIDERGALSEAPAQIGENAVIAWAGPWPLRERSWDSAQQRMAHRFQILDASHNAWLALWENDLWWAEGRYR